MFTKLFTLMGVSAALLTATTMSATNIAFADDEKIETVYVSATRSEGPQMPVATQITVVDSEQIRVSGATTIAEVLRTQVGIQIQDADGSGGRNVSVSMRGFSATAINNILILVDGRKLNNPTLAGPALNTVALKDIERIEIIQGSAGVLYGDQAVGGVINVITRHAKAGEIHGAITADKGTGNLENYTATVNQGFENGLNYSFSAQKRNADNYRDNNQSAITNVLGNIGFNFDKGRVFIEKQKVQDELHLAGSLTTEDVAMNPRLTYTPNDFSNQDSDLKRAGGEIDIFSGWKLLAEYADRDETGNYFYDDYYTDDGYFPYVAAYEMRVKNITPRIVGNIATANGAAVVTLGYDKVNADYSTKDTYTDITQKVDGFYAQVIYPITQKLNVTAGARHASVDDTNRKALDENFNTVVKNRDLSVNSEEVGLNYQIDSAWRVFARYADGFRFANADENNFILPGIDFLEVQTSTSEETGVAWADKSASVKYSVYHMNLDNEITYDALISNPGGFGGHGANINLPKSERQGFMFDGNVQLSEQFGLRGNYTYTDATSESGSFKDKYVPFVAKNTANVGFVFNLVKNVTTSIDVNYVGNRYHADDYANAAAKVDAVTLFNFNILWDISDVELGFLVKNITNERYSDLNATYGQFPQPGRVFNAHAAYRF